MQQNTAPEVAPVLLSDEQSAALMGISKRKFHELRAELWLPKPVVLGPRLLRWSRVELERAIAAMPRQEHAEQPAQLRRHQIGAMKRAQAAPFPPPAPIAPPCHAELAS